MGGALLDLAPGALGELRGTKCFVAGTDVLVDDLGTPDPFDDKDIEDVAVDDYVWARDDEDPTAPMALRRVVALHRSTAYDLQQVSVRDEASGAVQVITATDEHPFYVEGTGWLGAANLSPGQRLLTADGRTATVVANADDYRPEGVAVYNFEVEADHTYFVSAPGGGETDVAVWVHNACVPKHHIATDKHQDWTPKFEVLFKRAKMSMQHPLNVVKVRGHKGPHPFAYHQAVYTRLTAATKGLRGGTRAYTESFSKELTVLRADVRDATHVLNKLLKTPGH